LRPTLAQDVSCQPNSAECFLDEPGNLPGVPSMRSQGAGRFATTITRYNELCTTIVW